MMLYWHFRNLQCILTAFFKSRITDPRTSVTKRFWANPLDSDWLQGIQAGTFFLYTDAARWDLGVRTGFVRAAIRNGWVIVLGGQKIIHRRPVKIFRSFDLQIRFAGWDDKWIYASHVFSQSGEAKCVSFTKIGIRKRGKLLSPVEAFKTMGFAETCPPPKTILNHFADDLDVFAQVSAPNPN